MAGERIFKVQILGNADGAIAAFKKLAREGQESFERVQSIGSKLGAAFDFVKKGAFIAVGALTAVAGAATAAVFAAAKDQESQKLLEAQLIRSAGATTAMVSETEAFIEAAMMATGIADDDLRPAFGNLVRATGDLEKSQRLFNLALDISAATSRDLESVTLGLGRAATGQIGALTRLGIPLDEGAKKSKDFGAILKQLEGQFGGAAATAADTFSGRVKILKTSLGEVVESIGYLLLPVAEKLIAIFQTRLVPALKAAVDGFKEKGLTGALKYFLAALGPAGIGIINTFESITLAVLTLGGQVQKLAAAIALAGVVLNPKGAWDAYNAIVNLSANAAATASLNFDKLRAGVYQAGISANLAGNKLSGLIDQTDKIGTKVLPKAKEATDDWGDSLKDVKDTAGGVAKTVDDTKANLEKYTSALKSSTSAQKALTSAQKGTREAQLGVFKANKDLLTAQENLDQATRGFGADSPQAKAAQRELAKAQRNVANAGFAVEESVFAVTDAEKKLAELRADPLSSPQVIRQAEIDLAQAKLAVADASDTEFEATNGLKDAQLKLNEAVSGAIDGSDTYNEFLKLVNDAKDAQITASERLFDATERETEAFEALAEAIKKVADAAALIPNGGLTIPTLPGVPTPAGSGTTFGGQSDPSVQVVVNTGIGTNGVEAGRQIVELLQQYTRVDAFAIDRLGFAPRR
jgi:hypothetical protein